MIRQGPGQLAQPPQLEQGLEQMICRAPSPPQPLWVLGVSPPCPSDRGVNGCSLPRMLCLSWSALEWVPLSSGFLEGGVLILTV